MLASRPRQARDRGSSHLLSGVTVGKHQAHLALRVARRAARKLRRRGPVARLFKVGGVSSADDVNIVKIVHFLNRLAA